MKRNIKVATATVKQVLPTSPSASVVVVFATIVGNSARKYLPFCPSETDSEILCDPSGEIGGNRAAQKVELGVTHCTTANAEIPLEVSRKLWQREARESMSEL